MRRLAAPPDVEGDIEPLLVEAVAAGAISRDEATLILASRFEGRPLAALAEEEAVAYNSLKLRRQRAERRLLLYLGYPPVPRGRQRRPLSQCSDYRRAAGAGRAGDGNQSTTQRR